MNYVKLEVYVPQSHADSLKNALADAGAGRLGNYDSCIWQSLGIGQFRPLPGSHPAIGSSNTLQSLPEVKLEMICDSTLIPQIIAALKRHHPYETPAFQYWPVSLQ